MFERLCIIGVGLIGGSIARAARSHGLAGCIVGYGREQERQNLETAKRLGVIDDFFLDIEPALNGADAVVVAVPVGAVEAVFALLKPYWSNECVYSDVGSTKSNVVAAAERVFGFVPDNLVPAHPIAGAENSGVEASLPDLFLHRRLIITPLPHTEPAALSKIQAFWERMGSFVSVMSAEHHDAILAATSHLPHLLAFALVDMLGRQDEQCEIFKYAAGGFRDFTRIASSDPTMWRDICTANKDQLIPLLHQLKSELDKIEQLLADNDGRRLFETFSYARNARQRFLDQLEN
ncbi:prephenate dehydrogenase/arogenate dehydrogenase family protein [Methylomicrobium sp. Wu6]|uniref:prephenate dehydrogenase n=1 Tax=Methylomicrobium sp. Wu6 TaxID=3107928 RepID=UPI002DD66A0A|nr:prephenate dehydrogenase/arogenate dehydrogenase family protein [Methylomicrobium sp. Wu6]MEC4747876.1 prephenate dehydrogenase/arogenate dehydrogenase family protein [Methylomicrobium sp. Wu6]